MCSSVQKKVIITTTVAECNILQQSGILYSRINCRLHKVLFIPVGFRVISQLVKCIFRCIACVYTSHNVQTIRSFEYDVLCCFVLHRPTNQTLQWNTKKYSEKVWNYHDCSLFAFAVFCVQWRTFIMEIASPSLFHFVLHISHSHPDFPISSFGNELLSHLHCPYFTSISIGVVVTSQTVLLIKIENFTIFKMRASSENIQCAAKHKYSIICNASYLHEFVCVLKRKQVWVNTFCKSLWKRISLHFTHTFW